mmetsp:Transcript_53273/g.95604  ORF Transcript_53273/g.95604 Transcript_53273/m.95604 type:complete len:320 (+) Transcript_53273:92-1051(+)
MPLHDWLAAAVGFSVATVLGLGANRLLEAVGHGQEEELLDGFPRSRWHLSVAFQALIFPTLCLASVLASRAHGLSFAQYLKAPSIALPLRARWYVYSLFGSQARDMCPMPAATSMLMKVHHWVVVCACALALMAPKGFGLFTASTFVLECGSMMYNLRVLYPGSSVINVLYQVVMLISNSVAILGGVYFLKISDVPLWFRLLFFIADFGVCLGRQRHALKDAGFIGSKNEAFDAESRGAAASVATLAMPQRRAAAMNRSRTKVAAKKACWPWAGMALAGAFRPRTPGQALPAAAPPRALLRKGPVLFPTPATRLMTLGR